MNELTLKGCKIRMKFNYRLLNKIPVPQIYKL